MPRTRTSSGPNDMLKIGKARLQAVTSSRSGHKHARVIPMGIHKQVLKVFMPSGNGVVRLRLLEGSGIQGLAGRRKLSLQTQSHVEVCCSRSQEAYEGP